MEAPLREVGSNEAKTRLPELLKAVEKGETIVITRRGVAVARLVPAELRTGPVEPVIARIKAARERGPDLSLCELFASRHDRS